MSLIVFSITIAIAVIAWTNGQRCTDPVFMRNYRWYTNVSSMNMSCLNPKTEQDIVDYVNMAASMGNASIRGIGKSISWSACGMMETTDYDTNTPQTVFFVNQTAHRTSCTVDESAQQMTCEAGISVLDLCNNLHDHSLGLPSFGGPVIANMVGSFNSGTHGKGSSSNPIGNMARQVTQFKMVLANGSIITASEDENADIFHAGVISIGSLGIITEFTVQAEEFYNITRWANEKWEDVSNKIEDWEHIESLVCNNLSTLLNEVDFIYGGYQTFDQRFDWQNYVYATEENRQDRLCWNYETQGFNEFPCTDAYWRAISPFPTQDYLHGADNEAEFYVYEEDFEKAYLAGLYWVIKQQDCNPCMWNKSLEWHLLHDPTDQGKTGEIQINARWIGPDSNWLSPAYSEDGEENGKTVAQIGIYIPGEFVNPETPYNTTNRAPLNLWNFWVRGYYEAIVEAVSPNPVRVHWGKASQTDYCDISSSYPKMDDYRQLREELDPNNLFTNQMVRDKFGVGCNDCCCTGYTCDLTDYPSECEPIDLTCGRLTNPECPANTQDDDDSAYNNNGYNNIVFTLVSLIFVLFFIVLI